MKVGFKVIYITRTCIRDVHASTLPFRSTNFLESVSCRLDANDPTQVTLTIALKWYKFGTLTALDYSDFVAGDETNPTGPQTFVSTPAKCTATLANPGTSTAADTYSVTMALASPECGVDIVSPK